MRISDWGSYVCSSDLLGYLIAGALVGPQGLGLVGGAESKLAIAEIGIVLLLFLVGLELKPQRLWRLKRDIFALGFLQVALCGAALAAIIYFSTSFTWGAAIALGLPLSLSSTAQVLPSLKNSGRINRSEEHQSELQSLMRHS